VSTGFSPGPSKDFLVGKRRYETVVLPPHMENLNEATAIRLENFVSQGGRVFCCGPPPNRIDGKLDDRIQELADQPTWYEMDTQHLAQRLLDLAPEQDYLHVRRAAEDRGILFHQRRHLDDGDLLLLVNTSTENASAGEVVTDAKGLQRWDPATGEISPYPFEVKAGQLKAQFQLPPCGSLLLVSSERPTAQGRRKSRSATVQTAAAEVRRLEANVLSLDYVDITTAGKAEERVYCYRANQMAWQAAGMERNPWDSAVQFRDELITRPFPSGSGFQATYRFTLQGDIPRPLHVVIERPDLYEITCNGKPVAAKPHDWWLDKSFGRIDVSDVAREGENVVVIKAQPMTVYHELEPAYVLGDFSLVPVDSGFVIVPPKPLAVDESGWNAQGCPFYAGGVAYRESFDVSEPKGRYFVSLPDWRGSVARVHVNGNPAGHIAWQPWECDVTDQIQTGANTIEVVVVGTLKNTLGPHHAGTLRGAAWPSMFHRGPANGPPPGKDYDTVAYGLFAPFELKNAR
jgi:hypothetical protein